MLLHNYYFNYLYTKILKSVELEKNKNIFKVKYKNSVGHVIIHVFIYFMHKKNNINLSLINSLI